nr:MAG TPA: Rad52/22 family double-strand break repair protein [Caudoviricetes sp.]
MDSRYIAVKSVPQSALKVIDFGKLKGKYDISPQWRWEILTETYGMCGIGWYFDIVETKEVLVEATGETMLYVKVNLYIKDGSNEWSKPIPGYGGDFLIQKDKNGYHGNDEAFKMAVTDALGTAAKMIGVGADVYRGLQDTKINAAAEKEKKEKDFDPHNAYAIILKMAKEHGVSEEQVAHQLTEMFGVGVIDNITRNQMSKLYDWVKGYEVDNK